LKDTGRGDPACERMIKRTIRHPNEKESRRGDSEDAIPEVSATKRTARQTVGRRKSVLKGKGTLAGRELAQGFTDRICLGRLRKMGGSTKKKEVPCP